MLHVEGYLLSFFFIHENQRGKFAKYSLNRFFKDQRWNLYFFMPLPLYAKIWWQKKTNYRNHNIEIPHPMPGVSFLSLTQ